MRSVPRHTSAPAGRLAGIPVRGVGVGLGVLRCAVGAVMLGDPPRLARLLGVDSVTARQTGWLTMMTGGREVALGAGSLLALGVGSNGSRWYAAQALTDAGDTFALATAVRTGRVSKPIGTAIAVFALVGAGLNLAAMRAAWSE